MYYYLSRIMGPPGTFCQFFFCAWLCSRGTKRRSLRTGVILETLMVFVMILARLFGHIVVFDRLLNSASAVIKLTAGGRNKLGNSCMGHNVSGIMHLSKAASMNLLNMGTK